MVECYFSALLPECLMIRMQTEMDLVDAPMRMFR